MRREHDEADRLLGQQRGLLAGFESIQNSETARGQAASGSGPSAPDQPYVELLRNYVIMGSGSMSDEIRSIAATWADNHVTAHQAMLRHVEALEKLLLGVSGRGARHLMTRADMLILELMLHLAEAYRMQSENAERSEAA